MIHCSFLQHMIDMCGVSLPEHRFYQLSPKQWQRVEYQYISLFGLCRVITTDGLNIIIAVNRNSRGFVKLINIYQIGNSVVLP